MNGPSRQFDGAGVQGLPGAAVHHQDRVVGGAWPGVLAGSGQDIAGDADAFCERAHRLADVPCRTFVVTVCAARSRVVAQDLGTGRRVTPSGFFR